MPKPETFTFRLSPDERARLEAAAATAGVSPAEYVRRALEWYRDRDIPTRVADLERRLAELERRAGQG